MIRTGVHMTIEENTEEVYVLILSDKRVIIDEMAEKL
jgi:hypothetical protein